jgi:4-hydroxy-tetrahydrodipicolinate reductase
MSLKVCLAGATGWAGSELARGVGAASDLTLVAGVSRSHAGRILGDVLNDSRLTSRLYASASEALVESCDIFVEYTKPASAKANIMLALQAGAHVVVGASGLTEDDFAELDAVARQRQRGVLACGNFALTAVLLQKFAESAAKYLPNWEIVEYGSGTKADVPSGTVRELALRLSQVRQPEVTIAPEKAIGPRESRGATVAGTQVHSVRLPGHVLGIDVIYGMPDQTLTLRHQAGSSARPYVDGALLAIRKVSGLVGVHRGLDRVLDL